MIKMESKCCTESHPAYIITVYCHKSIFLLFFIMNTVIT